MSKLVMKKSTMLKMRNSIERILTECTHNYVEIEPDYVTRDLSLLWEQLEATAGKIEKRIAKRLAKK